MVAVWVYGKAEAYIWVALPQLFVLVEDDHFLLDILNWRGGLLVVSGERTVLEIFRLINGFMSHRSMRKAPEPRPESMKQVIQSKVEKSKVYRVKPLAMS